MDQQREQSPPATEPPRDRYSVSWVLWILAIVFVLYPLSVGPAVAVYSGVPRPLQGCLEALYRPLQIVASTIRPMDDYLFWYAQMWQSKPPRPASTPSSPTNAPPASR